MMIRIAICDDEVKVGAELEEMVGKILAPMKVKYEVDVLFAPEELERQMRQGVVYDLLFLDIEYLTSSKNGIELAKLIRDVYLNNRVSIVFISRESKYALELFQVQPLDFLVKPLDEGKVGNVLRKYVELSGIWKKEFSYKKGRNVYKVQVQDIVYVESVGRKVFLHLVNQEEVEFYGSIGEVYEQLKAYDFLHIHASYVVNYDHIASLTFDRVKLAQGGADLPISRHRQDEVRSVYQAIFERRML